MKKSFDVPVESQCVFLEVKEHPNTVSFLEEVVLASQGVEEGAAGTELLGRATGQSPRPAPNGTGLDANDPVRPTAEVRENRTHHSRSEREQDTSQQM